MKKIALLVIVLSTLAIASSIKVWGPGDVLSSTDLNANFAHIHSLMVGGHGARLMDADVNASAGIAHSKLATPGVIAKSIFIVGSGITPCTAGTCTTTGKAGVDPTVTWNSTGNYTVTIPARTDFAYFPLITPVYCGGTVGCTCGVQTGTSTTAFTVTCQSITTATPPVITSVNAVFGVAIFDDNN